MNHVVLVADGLEACDGDPAGIARRLRATNHFTVVDVVGFGVGSQEDATLLRSIAAATGGVYHDAPTVAEFDEAFNPLAGDHRIPASPRDAPRGCRQEQAAALVSTFGDALALIRAVAESGARTRCSHIAAGLLAEHGGIGAVGGEQPGVGALLDDAAGFEHDDPVGHSHVGEAV
jgi:hypothetical protein